jgi:hypothetical protein
MHGYSVTKGAQSSRFSFGGQKINRGVVRWSYTGRQKVQRTAETTARQKCGALRLNVKLCIQLLRHHQT